MRVLTLLFTYIRPEHTKRVLEGLENCINKPDQFRIVHDGLKKRDDPSAWSRVDDEIRSVSWCKPEIVINPKNKGLSATIIEQVTRAFEEYDAVIVLEDDCVPATVFFDFICDALHKYKDNEKVWGVSGYSWPIGLSRSSDDDAYACGRVSTWGWATWKNRWQKYKKDWTIVERLRSTSEGSVLLDTWGSDLDDMIKATAAGYNDSWAVHWALEVIENQGCYINPYESLVENIGFDGSGTNCTAIEIDSKENVAGVSYKKTGGFKFPDSVEFSQQVKKCFSAYMGSRVVNHVRDICKPDIVVYGAGMLYREKEEQILSRYNIVLYIDNGKKGFYGGVRIESLEMFDYSAVRDSIVGIVIMVRKLTEKEKVKNELINNKGVDKESFIEI